MTSKPVITILEGPDGAGKTTLAETLRARCGANGLRTQYLHQGPFGGDPYAETLRTLAALDPGLVLMDRSYLGEQVYGPIFRGTDALGDARRRLLDRRLLSLSAVVVRCLPTIERTMDAWRARRDRGGEMFRDEPRVRATWSAFALLRTALPVVGYDYADDDVDGLLRRVNAARPPVNLGPGIGWWAPDGVLVVGAMADVGVAEALEHRGIPERGVYWAPASIEDVPTDSSFVLGLLPRAVCAVGPDALTWCERAGLDPDVACSPRDVAPLLDLIDGGTT